MTAGLPNILGEILIWFGTTTQFAAAEEISEIGIGTIMIGAMTTSAMCSGLNSAETMFV